MSLPDIGFRLLAIFSLIAINAFFVTGEFAIVSVRRSRINHLVLEGDIPSQTVQSLQKSLDRLLSTTQLGITLSSLALGWIGESTMAQILQSWIIALSLPANINQILIHSVSIPLSFILLVYLQIVLGELCPKSFSLLYAENLARFLAPPIRVIGIIFKPFIDILNQSTKFILRLFGAEYTGQGWYKQVTPEELQLIIRTEKESSGLEAEERELLSNVFEFGDVEAMEIMTPRVNIDYLSLDSTYQDLIEEVAKTGHSRYPVIGESLDDIRGIINLKDSVSFLGKHEDLENNQNPPLSENKLSQSIKDLIRPVKFLSEFTPLSELLNVMQQSRLKMVIIVDEYGGTAGLVSMQNLINEILGHEEKSITNQESEVTVIDEQNFLVWAQINLEELNDLLDFNLPLTEEYTTLGGFLIYQWQKIPSRGEKYVFDNLVFTIADMDGPRIHKIKVTIQDSTGEMVDNQG
ncbi:HlyC/CorC family transporter [Cyanobacterium stanieri LEGE 03274]|uniref:HlyC/CorC family transporter n=1 Tax=Cyanobacterium stanieri LEGE 03274 TaxID=1828756 RepID=A0ABR9V3H0_9CHRO|nr:hemolysin family protein [Cyanobacterium stanieri]MBE9222449.1 HlyC/CorC family transporter [Cyanobacterium stanieri LEGE 03274]